MFPIIPDVHGLGIVIMYSDYLSDSLILKNDFYSVNHPYDQTTLFTLITEIIY